MQRPRPPITVIALIIVAVAGLFTQFLAAETAFALIGRTTLYSIFAALLIELAIVVDAIVVARNRNIIALAGLIIAMVVSAVYNYTLADLSSTDYVLRIWQKLALALGPLFALAAIGLALGEELYKYSLQLDAYEQDQEAYQASLREEGHERNQHQQRLARDQLAFDREQSRERAQFKMREEQLATRRAERWARKEKAAQHIPQDNGREAPSPIDELLTVVPHALDSIDAYETACIQHPALAKRITPKQLAARIDQSQRTARRWVARTR